MAESKIKVARAAAKQALSWADEDDTGVNRAKALRIAVIKNLFHPKECQVSMETWTFSRSRITLIGIQKWYPRTDTRLCGGATGRLGRGM